MSSDPKFAQPVAKKPLKNKVLFGIFAAIIIGLLALSIITLQGRGNQQAMHPDSVSPDGAGALGSIIEDRGATITVVRTADEALDHEGTILVWDPFSLLTERERESLIESGRPVVAVMDEGRGASLWLTGNPRAFSSSSATPTGPNCSVDWVSDLDAIDGATWGIDTNNIPATGCFPVTSGHYLAVEGNVSAFASPEVFTNDYLDRAHNAAVAIRALGHTDSVSWIIPTETTATDSSISAVPPALTGALAGFAIAALWYGICVRRPVGPLIPESLPVIVPSAESARGRARLYERGGNAGHAGKALRAGTIARVAARLGIPSEATPENVISRISEASGWHPDRVSHVLYGPPPTTDRELVDLAHELTALTKELIHD